MTSYRVRGETETGSQSLLPHLDSRVEVRQSVAIEAGLRDGAPTTEIDVGKDDILEVELEDGFVLWTTIDRLEGDVERAGLRQRGDDTFPLRYPKGRRDTERGIVADAIRAVRILDIDLPGNAAQVAAGKIESQLEGGGGFFRISSTGVLSPEDPQPGRDGEPILLLIHGTASSTANAYGGFFDANIDLWRELHESYDGRVYGFEHKTLTQSPLDNALQALASLPAGSNLHLVTHSRGGLVGDLLAHGTLASAPFDDADVERELLRAYGKKSPRVAEQAELYRQFNRRILDVAPNVTRYVRVGCPAAGTTLASGRLDVYLSIAIHLLRAVPGVGPILGGLGEFAAAVARERTDPASLPGLEAQTPTSPFMRLLNGTGHELDTDLTVLAGDSDGFIKNLANLFYWRANDLVVDTRSMFGGARRRMQRWHLEENRHVTHVNYFRRLETARIVRDGLLRADDDSAGFETTRPKRALRGRVKPGEPADNTELPAVVLLPGIMGSNLAAVSGQKRNRIWVDASDLMKGEGRKLAIDSGTAIEPAGVFDSPYRDFRDFLVRQGLHVMPLGYDWRLSLTAAAKRLNDILRQRFEQSERPVYLVAHSMGGLVASLFMTRHTATWERLRERGGRLVQAGTPNLGSYSIPLILSGDDDSVRLLAMLDVKNGLDKWIRWASRFPGVLELAPSFGGADFSRVDTWRELGAKTAPTATDLRAAAAIRQTLSDQAAELAGQGVLYVAGGPQETPVYDDAHNAIRFTMRGDGKVTWQSGIPIGAPTWYVPVKHGDLLNTPGAFVGLRELLIDGHTDQLTREQPVASDRMRGAPQDAPPLAPDEQVQFVPSNEDLEAAVLGMSYLRPGTRSDSPPVPPTEVTVVHGDLRFTENPVLVGHYRGDQIVHAEKALDNCLDGALSSRHQLGVYPGEIGTAEVLVKRMSETVRSPSPNGAIVVGLGNVGELSPGGLTRAVEAGLLRYAQVARERGLDTTALKVSTLLVGTGEAGVSTLQAIDAFLLALRNANKALSRLQSGDDTDAGPQVPLIHFAKLEFVELYRDIALQALHVLASLPERREFVVQKKLHSRLGGRRRVRMTTAPAWWPRIQVCTETPEADGARRLVFTTFGGRARAPETRTYVQRALVDRLVADTLRDRNGKDNAIAETLFELLVPTQLKAGASERRDLQLVLDEASAAYPWELLADRRADDAGPVGVAAGLLRQLRVSDVPAVSHPENNCILVVGDPPSSMERLDGARDEAIAVADQFARRKGWTVIEQIRDRTASLSSTSIVSSLLTNDVRILHLAGHGVYDPDEPLRSGMVIGDGTDDDPYVLITAAEVQQMRMQPELVFINCCHLGRIEPTTPFHKLAANLATAFIKAGVKTVIAAGWPVDDDAAATFCRSFYREMLTGADFGTAINVARKQTYARGSNTWGAYQCYGEPGFRLLMDVAVRARVSGSYYSPDSYLDSSELVVELSNLESRASIDVDADARGRIARRVAELDTIVAHKDWAQEPDVVVSLARIYAQIGDYERAIDRFETASRISGGGVTLGDLEQLANCRGRIGARDKSIALVRRSIADVKRLLQQHGDTTERLSLLGAGYKRAAQLAKLRTDLRDEIRSMTEAYIRAAELRDDDWYYPASNAMLGIVLLGGPWARKPRSGTVAADTYAVSDWMSRKVFDQLADEIGAALRQREFRKFWDAVAVPDFDVVIALGERRIGEHLPDLVDGYRQVIDRFGSGREIDSIVNQWSFAHYAADVLGNDQDVAALERLAAALRR